MILEKTKNLFFFILIFYLNSNSNALKKFVFDSTNKNYKILDSTLIFEAQKKDLAESKVCEIINHDTSTLHFLYRKIELGDKKAAKIGFRLFPFLRFNAESFEDIFISYEKMLERYPRTFLNVILDIEKANPKILFNIDSILFATDDPKEPEDLIPMLEFRITKLEKVSDANVNSLKRELIQKLKNEIKSIRP